MQAIKVASERTIFIAILYGLVYMPHLLGGEAQSPTSLSTQLPITKNLNLSSTSLELLMSFRKKITLLQ